MASKIMLEKARGYFAAICKKYFLKTRRKELVIKMKSLIKSFSAVLLAALTAIMGIVGYYDATLPEYYYVSGSGVSSLTCFFDVTLTAKEDALSASTDNCVEADAELKLFGIIPIKDAKVTKSDPPMLIPGGTPIGIKLLTDGVMVVKVQDVEKGVCPAVDAGICAGDNIIEADGVKISSSSQLSEIISASKGNAVQITLTRDGQTIQTAINPVFSENDGTYKGGMWIRDSSAGVGTLTFIDPYTGIYGALGHPISDCDTYKMLPLGSGEIADVTITGYESGTRGCPGELYGKFVSGLASGSIIKNCDQGVFGKMTYASKKDAIPIAFKSEVKTGAAKMLATIEGNSPKEYDVEIEKLSLSPAAKTKNIVIRVTDGELLEQTGGIVQGMSGSPIIQDGKLVGAVTHVFVSDPTRGYGILIEDMLEEANELIESSADQAA